MSILRRLVLFVNRYRSRKCIKVNKFCLKDRRRDIKYHVWPVVVTGFNTFDVFAAIFSRNEEKNNWIATPLEPPSEGAPTRGYMITLLWIARSRVRVPVAAKLPRRSEFQNRDITTDQRCARTCVVNFHSLGIVIPIPGKFRKWSIFPIFPVIPQINSIF